MEGVAVAKIASPTSPSLVSHKCCPALFDNLPPIRIEWSHSKLGNQKSYDILQGHAARWDMCLIVDPQRCVAKCKPDVHVRNCDRGVGRIGFPVESKQLMSGGVFLDLVRVRFGFYFVSVATPNSTKVLRKVERQR